MGAEPKTRTLKLRNITVDAAIQPRAAGLDDATVEEYAAAMKAGAAFPPCRVFKSAGGSLWLSRGFHRYAGAERAGLVEIECEVVNGDRKDAVIDAACSNTDHGLKRTNADKRKAVEILLRECPDWSDGKLAAEASVDPKTVATIRKESHSDAGQVGNSRPDEPTKRIGKDGKTYTVKPKADPKPVDPTPDEATASGPDDEPERMPETVDGPNYGVEQVEGAGDDEESAANPAPAVEDAPADPENPPLDPRFMPGAARAVGLAEKFRTWKAQLVALRTAVRKEFPDRDDVMARRIDARGQFDAALTELADTLDRNIPEHVCPDCCGTGAPEAGGVCKFCDGFGVIDRHHHGGLKARWKRTAPRLTALAAAAGGAD